MFIQLGRSQKKAKFKKHLLCFFKKKTKWVKKKILQEWSYKSFLKWIMAVLLLPFYGQYINCALVQQSPIEYNSIFGFWLYLKF